MGESSLIIYVNLKFSFICFRETVIYLIATVYYDITIMPILNPEVREFTPQVSQLNPRAASYVPQPPAQVLVKIVSSINPNHVVHIVVVQRTGLLLMSTLQQYFPNATGTECPKL